MFYRETTQEMIDQARSIPDVSGGDVTKEAKLKLERAGEAGKTAVQEKVEIVAVTDTASLEV